MNHILDRQRLAKLLGMMGSAHDAEVIAAARQAERLRIDAKLTWAEIVVPGLPAPPQRQNVGKVAEVIRFVLDHANALTEWERDFARSVAWQQSPLTPKQRVVLDRLVEKAQRAEARAA
jgi:hypothetical protein